MTGALSDLNPELLRVLSLIEKKVGFPLHVNDGLRPPDSNAALVTLGLAVADSAHLTGLAVDCKALTSSDRYRIVVAALGAGFERIGIGKTFVHLDIDPSKPQGVIWLYKAVETSKDSVPQPL